ncbi:MAG: hypothetical protein QW818_02460 [Candidatus Aenigmatarchaeota archaeon]
MADLSELQATLPTRIIGSTLSGVETTPLAVNSDQEALTTNSTIRSNNIALAPQSTLVAGTDGVANRPLATDPQGRLIVSALTGFNADFSFGRRTTNTTTRVPVYGSTYNEPTTASVRSFSSTSAADSATGTGARTIRVVYMTPSYTIATTDVTLNGTTPVNTAVSDILYVEEAFCLTVGSGGTNAGTITMFNAAGGGGGTLLTIPAGEGQTFFAHHYIETGRVCNVTGISCSHNGTTVGSGGVFEMRARLLNVSNAFERQVSDFVRLYGQSSTFSRVYQSPIKVAGPARLLIYVTPESSSSIVYRASFDFFEP